MGNEEWQRVSKAHPCSICAKPDWCTVSDDGSVACCMRIESEKSMRNGGWLHRLDGKADFGWTAPGRRIARRHQTGNKTNWSSLQSLYAGYLCEEALLKLASSLGVPRSALQALGVGQTERRTFSFPMRNRVGDIVGIRLRSLKTGRKWAVQGSRLGLFYDPRRELDDTVWVCEGASDTAAMLGLGLCAIGRPGCQQCEGMTAELIGRRDVVIVADLDPPGRLGAESLAHALAKRVRTIRIMVPSAGQDVREWIRAGATRDVVEAVANGRRYWDA